MKLMLINQPISVSMFSTIFHHHFLDHSFLFKTFFKYICNHLVYFIGGAPKKMQEEC